MITEKIFWIIDSKKNKFDYQFSIDFVHSFGLKCDCVGWCTMPIKSEKDFELLEQIKEKAKALNVKTRLYYEKKETEIEAEWYILNPRKEVDFEFEKGVKAYNLTPNDHIAEACDLIIVSEKFMNACKNFEGAKFAYVKDIGRFKSKPHYYILPNESAKYELGLGKRFIGSYKKNKKEYEAIDSYGGNLSRIASCFDEIEHLDIPIMITKEDEPCGDFCYIAYEDCSQKYFLVRKKVAEVLLNRNIVKKSELAPVRYCDKKAHKNMLYKCKPRELYSKEILAQWEKDKEKLESKSKPIFEPNEKLALQLLRKAKKERVEDFNRSLSKVFLEKIEDDLAILSPIFKITNGCYLNDEICLFSYNEIERETKEFFEHLKDEEQLVKDMPELLTAKAIGATADGDKILLLNDLSVMRYQHEDAYLSEKYKSIWEFIFEMI